MQVKPLASHATISSPEGPLVFIVIDGVGLGRRDEFDAFHQARTPTLDGLYASTLYCSLQAHGTAVGLPSDADLGGSEVGHNVMGAGRVVPQGPKLVDGAFQDESIWQGAWQGISADLAKSGATLHLVGLLSNGNIHSNQAHLYQLIDRAAADGIERLRVHVLFDGRDVPDRTSPEYLEQLENVLGRYVADGRDYRIASGGGRMLSIMDRYNADWRIVERGWNAMVHGEGPRFSSAGEAVAKYQSEDRELSDQYIPVFVVTNPDGSVTKVADGDAVIMFNFRGDRAVELCAAFESGDDFTGFDRGRVPEVTFAGMMLYDGDLGVPANYLVTPSKTEGCLSEFLAKTGVTQFACAETQKFGHVTYFWNGNRSGKFDEHLERYLEIPSDVCPFEQRPWMKAAETADAIIEAVEGGGYRFIRANFAGGDMVGHTGRMLPTIVALEAIDISIARVAEVVKRARGCLVVTADHGNAEDMVEREKDGTPKTDADGNPRRRTAHSLNPVPFAIVDYSDRQLALNEIQGAGLGNIASTLAVLLGYQPPGEYDESLVVSPPGR